MEIEKEEKALTSSQVQRVDEPGGRGKEGKRKEKKAVTSHAHSKDVDEPGGRGKERRKKEKKRKR